MPGGDEGLVGVELVARSAEAGAKGRGTAPGRAPDAD
jgi:hypothetical protein